MPAELRAVAARADRIGAEPARQAIASGLVDEISFYRALAATLGLRFVAEPPPILPGGEHASLLRAGLARLEPNSAGLRFLIAPEGAALRQMIEGAPGERADVAVTTPSAFAAALRDAGAPRLAARLAGVDRNSPSRRDARTGVTNGQIVAAIALFGLASFFGTLNPGATFAALSLIMVPLFLAMVVLRLCGVFEPAPIDLWREHGWRVDDARLPVYTVAVPLLRETRVLPKLIGALSRLDYPPAKLDIRLLVEQHDIELIAAIEATNLPAHMRMTIVPPGQPRTKPRALNLALIEARGELITIYDAEDVPEPQQLRAAAAMFLRGGPGLACVQARLVIDNGDDGILPSLFALEYAGLFDVVNPGLLRARLPIMLGGTSNHFRTRAMREIGGWDAWNVTEDADVGLRLVRAGYRFADLPSWTLEEAPRSLRVWLSQRSRWLKGYIQTMVTHLAEPRALVREAGLGQSMSFVALALGTIVSALGYPIFAAALAASLAEGSLLAREDLAGRLLAATAIGLPVAGAAAILGPALLGACRRRSYGLLIGLPLLPLYYLLVSLAAWLAVVDYVRHQHRWNKTPHGYARSSRYAALKDAAAAQPPSPPEAARC